MQYHFLAVVALAGTAAAQPYPYRITDLGVLPGYTSSVARGISPDGKRIVGWCVDRAFLWQDGSGMRELPPLPGYGRAYAYDVNDAGYACGQAGLEISGPEPARAVLWDPNGSPQNLGTLGAGRFSMAHGINRAVHLAGFSETLPNTTLWHAFLWQAGTGMIDLTPGAADSYAIDLNEFDQVAGYGLANAWRYTPRAGVQLLGAPTGFAYSAGLAINDAGQICGSATSASGNSQRIARYTDGVGWEILGGVGQHNQGTGINSFGQVAGAADSPPRPYLYTDGLGLQNLNELVDPAANWVLLRAFDINDRGQISGQGSNNTAAQTRGFRLDPVYVTVRGAGCIGGNGHQPKLGVAGLPRGGSRISIMLAEGRPDGTALLAFADASATLPLPGACTLLVGGQLVVMPISLDAVGRAVFPVDLPAMLAAGRVHLQYASLDAGAPNGIMALSNAVEVQTL